MKLFRSKRGLSPLIATILLIAFAVSLGAVVMNWGRGYVEEQQTDSACLGDIKLAMHEISGENQVCYKPGKDGAVKFFIDNIGKKDIDGLGVYIIDTKGNVKGSAMIQDSSIKATEYLQKEVKVDLSDMDEIKYIEFTPKMNTIEGDMIQCSRVKLIYSDAVPACK